MGSPTTRRQRPPAEGAGFRLIGWVELDTTAQDALAQLGADRIFGWDELRQDFLAFDLALPAVLNTLQLVERGRAYWVLFSPAPLPPIGLQLVTNEADRPVDVVAFSDTELLVVEQAGTVRRLTLGSGQFGATMLDIRDRVGFGGERGLLSIALDPNFAAKGRMYAWYWVDGQDRMRLARFIIANGSLVPGSELTVLDVPQPFGNHNGGRLLFGPDRYLYLSIGDGGSAADPQGHGQNRNTLLGTIVRIDVAAASIQTPYVVPRDNPFVATLGACGEIFAYGLRNPWRMSFDAQIGELWVGDVGQGEIEEIDIVSSGGHYGWDLFEGDECFESTTCSRLGLTGPVAFYTHADGCSITGGVVYRGSEYAAPQPRHRQPRLLRHRPGRRGLRRGPKRRHLEDRRTLGRGSIRRRRQQPRPGSEVRTSPLNVIPLTPGSFDADVVVGTHGRSGADRGGLHWRLANDAYPNGGAGPVPTCPANPPQPRSPTATAKAPTRPLSKPPPPRPPIRPPPKRNHPPCCSSPQPRPRPPPANRSSAARSASATAPASGPPTGASQSSTGASSTS